MSPLGASEPLSYRRIGRTDLGVIASVELEPEQIDRFLGPLDGIAAAVRAAPAHLAFRIDAGCRMAGFYVLHPDRRDPSCWWLGWLALDRREQGRGYGRRVIAHIVQSLRRIDICRRARLLVDPRNAGALRLYQAIGFQQVGRYGTGEFILEAVLKSPPGAALPELVVLPAPPKRFRRKGRVRRPHGPHPAFCIGIERGPPRRDDPAGHAGVATTSRTRAEHQNAAWALKATPWMRWPVSVVPAAFSLSTRIVS